MTNRSRIVTSVLGRRIVAAVVGVSAPALVYLALCLVVLHASDWLQSRSIFFLSLVGPPLWLLVEPDAHVVFWSFTGAIVAVAAFGASVRILMLPAAALCFLIWLGAGFLAVGMSI